MTDSAVSETANSSLLERASARKTAVTGTASLCAISALAILIHLPGMARYGFFRDELYYIACSEHLAWGYVDQPPLIALIAWISRHGFGNSLAAFRVFPALAAAVTVFLTGWLAVELGGGRLAQFVAALAILFAPLNLAFDSILTMNAFEPVFWLACACIAARIANRGPAKLWLLFGAIAGVGLENKHTMAVFGFAVVAGFSLSGDMRPFRSRWIWIGGLIALSIALPNLLWEAHHGWPQIEVVRNAQLFKNVRIGPLRFLAEQVLFYQPVTLPLWLGGLVWLFFAGDAKPFRFLGWAYVIVLAIFMVGDGKTYYPMGAYPMLMAAGGVAFQGFTGSHARAGRALRVAYPVVIAVAGLFTLPFGVPVLPVGAFLRYSNALPYSHGVKTERDSTAQLPQNYADMFGWKSIAATVARVYYELPDADRANCAILAGNYGEAGAIDYYGPALGLPKAIGGHNSYFYWGPRNYSGECVILFGEGSREFKDYFGDVREVATVSNPLAMPSEQSLTIYLCRKPRAPLAELWPHFKLII
ncbi:MAG: glycosyltransferase family 39 protein [Candidatus Acidiferrales bacterium]